MDERYIIIEMGSTHTKVGFAGKEAPSVIFPTVVGRPIVSGLASNIVGDKGYTVGTHAETNRGSLRLRYPVNGREVQHWDDVELILNHIFANELHINPEEYSILIIKKALTQRSEKEKMAKMLFDKFKVEALYIADSAACSLYAEGLVSGIVLEMNDGVINVIPIIDEYISSYPDMRLNLGSEQFQTMEVLFNPSLIGFESPGIHELLCKSIMRCEVEQRETLFNNIVLSGGSSLFLGLPERLSKEIIKIAPPNMQSKVRVIAKPERQYSAWIGGSNMACEMRFNSKWISKEEYSRKGVSIIHDMT